MDIVQGIFGKWHLGSSKKYFPTKHGFDEFYGILYSNDMWRWHPESPQSYPDDLLLYRNEDPIQEIIDQSNLTKDLHQRVIEFYKLKIRIILSFYMLLTLNLMFLYFVSKNFENKTGNGLYADVITEIDFSVGRIINFIRRKMD
jgi:arylsulfatase